MLIYDDAVHERWCARPDLSIGHGPGKNMSVNVARVVFIKSMFAQFPSMYSLVGYGMAQECITIQYQA